MILRSKKLDNIVICCEDGEIDRIYANSDVEVLLLNQGKQESSLDKLDVKTGTFASEFINHLKNNEGKEPFRVEDFRFDY